MWLRTPSEAPARCFTSRAGRTRSRPAGPPGTPGPLPPTRARPRGPPAGSRPGRRPVSRPGGRRAAAVAGHAQDAVDADAASPASSCSSTTRLRSRQVSVIHGRPPAAEDLGGHQRRRQVRPVLVFADEHRVRNRREHAATRRTDAASNGGTVRSVSTTGRRPCGRAGRSPGRPREARCSDRWGPRLARRPRR